MTQTDRGILTEADREFLEMDVSQRADGYSRSAQTQRRQAIRTRLYHALGDLRILFNRLSDRDRQRVFQELEEGLVSMPREPLLYDATALIALGVLEQEDLPLDDEEFYETYLRQVIENVLFDQGLGANRIDVEVDIEGWTPPGDLSEVAPENLRPDSLRRLLFEGEISNEEFSRGILAQTDEPVD